MRKGCQISFLPCHRRDGWTRGRLPPLGRHITSAEWLEVKKAVDGAYKWGMVKSGNYRHAGRDIATVPDVEGRFKIIVDQSYYIDGLQDVDMGPERLHGDDVLTKAEVAACRGALGALQWLAVQSQPQLAAGCNLPLTELVTEGRTQTA